MRSKILLILVAFGTALSGGVACSTPPTPDERVQHFVQLLKKDDHKIDEVVDSETGSKRPNVHLEAETEVIKRRTVDGKVIEIRKGDKIAEVVVVAPKSNCKFELELLLRRSPRSFYADRSRNHDGKEVGLPSDFPVSQPTPQDLEQYVDDHEIEFAFCADKPYQPSTYSSG